MDSIMAEPLPLPVWDRRHERLIEEYSNDLKATYESRPHRSIHQWLESHPVYDWLVAAYQNTHRSARQIEPFIKKHHIDMTEFKPVVYRSFAEFFDREFRPGVRTFPQAADEMGAFAEARYFGWERLEDDQELPLKGHSLSARRILGNEERARPFIGGPIILARLSPMDYHHLHYPDDGITLNQERLGYRLWTVNWYALLNKQDILFSNERARSTFWKPVILDGWHSWRSEHYRLVELCRFIRLIHCSSAGRKSRSLNSAVPNNPLDHEISAVINVSPTLGLTGSNPNST
jgi:phosphatidylserine decarboxylase